MRSHRRLTVLAITLLPIVSLFSASTRLIIGIQAGASWWGISNGSIKYVKGVVFGQLPRAPWSTFVIHNSPYAIIDWWFVFDDRGSYRHFSVPLWAMGLPAASAAWWLTKRRRSAEGCRPCEECGYDLQGNVSGACPECGTSALVVDRAGIGTSLRRIAVIFLILSVLSIIAGASLSNLSWWGLTGDSSSRLIEGVAWTLLFLPSLLILSYLVERTGSRALPRRSPPA